MNSLDVFKNILDTSLLDLKYCFVNEKKLPFTKNGEIAKVNNSNDFCCIDELLNDNIYKFKGLGISINFSNVIAIDVDKCFSTPFDINSGDERAKNIIELFKNYYVEFSFSGTGLRIILLNDNKKYDFKNDYYIKNSKNKIEIYYPHFKARYVTITGKYIYNNPIANATQEIYLFLNEYMRRDKTKIINDKLNDEVIDDDEINKRLKKLFIKNSYFLEVWTSKAPGSGKNESELDYYLLVNIVENITSNKELVKKVFEMSDYYLSKDKKHKYKWDKTNYLNDTLFRIMGR